MPLQAARHAGKRDDRLDAFPQLGYHLAAGGKRSESSASHLAAQGQERSRRFFAISGEAGSLSDLDAVFFGKTRTTPSPDMVIAPQYADAGWQDGVISCK